MPNVPGWPVRLGFGAFNRAGKQPMHPSPVHAVESADDTPPREGL
jgi:hypothetical protein